MGQSQQKAVQLFIWFLSWCKGIKIIVKWRASLSYSLNMSFQFHEYLYQVTISLQ